MTGFFHIKFAFTCNISLVWWKIFLLELKALNIYYRQSNGYQKFKKRICHVNVTNEKHLSKTISQWKFDYGLFTISSRIIAACDFAPSSFKLKSRILPLLTNTYPNLKSTCHTKLKFFLWTKLLDNLLFAKYLTSIAAHLTTPMQLLYKTLFLWTG